MPTPTTEACQSWLTDDDWASVSTLNEITADEKATSGLWASTWGWRVSEHSVGVCSRTRRFCQHWICRCERWRCSCGPRSKIDLGGRPVVSVDSAVINSDPAVTLVGPVDETPSQLQVIDYRWLVRADGLAWPTWPLQVEVTWSAGIVPDIVDRGAVLALAVEHVKLLRGGKCLLPEGMTQTRTGNGSVITMVDPFDKRLSGLPPVPAFYQWALAFFGDGTGGGLMDPAEHAGSYEVSWP